MKPFNKGKKFGKKTGIRKPKKEFKRPYPGPGGGFEKPYGSAAFSGSQGRGAGPGLYTAVCAECGEPCEVPFKPTGNRPVLCRRCFRQSEDGEADGRFSKRESGRNSRERGRGRGQERGGERRGASDVAGQLADINRKLDLIMEALDID